MWLTEDAGWRRFAAASDVAGVLLSALSRARRDVLVQLENVGRVPFVLELDQLRVLVLAVGRAQARNALVGLDEVRQGGPHPERAHRLGKPPRPSGIAIVLGRVHPHGETE